jgi:hypothetical protein
MKQIKLLGLLYVLIAFSSCDTLKKTSNTASTIFSLNGQWELSSNTPENTLVGSRVTVTPFIGEARFVSIANNSQCFRENDVKWKNIVSTSNGGFTLNNLLSSCNTGSLNYQPAVINVVSNDEIRVVGKNLSGQDNMQTWRRIQ